MTDTIIEKLDRGFEFQLSLIESGVKTKLKQFMMKMKMFNQINKTFSESTEDIYELCIRDYNQQVQNVKVAGISNWAQRVDLKLVELEASL